MQEIHHFFHSLFSLTLDFRVRLFNILALGGTVISLIMAFLSLGTGSFGNVLINLLTYCWSQSQEDFFFIPITVENISAAT